MVSQKYFGYNAMEDRIGLLSMLNKDQVLYPEGKHIYVNLFWLFFNEKPAHVFLQLPDSTAANFVQSSQVPGMMEEVCNRIQMHCTGQHQQFNSFNDCMEYMRSLPVLDPLCKLNVGPLAVQGNCFMCKFLQWVCLLLGLNIPAGWYFSDTVFPTFTQPIHDPARSWVSLLPLGKRAVQIKRSS